MFFCNKHCLKNCTDGDKKREFGHVRTIEFLNVLIFNIFSITFETNSILFAINVLSLPDIQNFFFWTAYICLYATLLPKSWIKPAWRKKFITLVLEVYSNKRFLILMKVQQFSLKLQQFKTTWDYFSAIPHTHQKILARKIVNCLLNG